MPLGVPNDDLLPDRDLDDIVWRDHGVALGNTDRDCFSFQDDPCADLGCFRFEPLKQRDQSSRDPEDPRLPGVEDEAAREIDADEG